MSMNSRNKAIQIAHRAIGPDQPPFIIAEMSGNHNQSLERALKIVEAAAEAGADALKLQTYTADTMTLNLELDDFIIQDKKSLWYGQTLFQLYENAHTPWEWHESIIKKCRELDLICFSSPFDTSAVDFLETLQVPAYKIASFEILDLPLIRKVAQTKKPMIISTGMATEQEIQQALSTAESAGCEAIVLLKCTSTYPANPEDSHLMTIPYLTDQFPNIKIGLSDHTPGLSAAISAVALGACVIEKHLTLSRTDGGVDSAFSLDCQEFTQLVREVKTGWLSLGKVFLGPTEAEQASLQFRRSLYAVQDIPKGQPLTSENVRAIRPGKGLSPAFYDTLLDARANQFIAKGTALKWELIEASQLLINQVSAADAE